MSTLGDLMAGHGLFCWCRLPPGLSSSNEKADSAITDVQRTRTAGNAGSLWWPHGLFHHRTCAPEVARGAEILGRCQSAHHMISARDMLCSRSPQATKAE